MRVVIDLQSAQSGSRLGGIGRYSLDLVKAVVKEAPEEDFIIILNDQHPEHLEEIRAEFRHLLEPGAIRVFAIPEESSYIRDSGEVAHAAELIREQFLVDLKPDFVFVTSLFEGFLEQVVTSVDRAGVAPPTAVTLYDLIPLTQFERYLADPNAKSHYLGKFRQLKKADLILAISDFSAREGLELIGAGHHADAVNIRGGVDPSFRKLPNAGRLIERLRDLHRITKPFLLYTASFDQRKNQSGLIRAFAQLPLNVRNAYQLVIVGGGWPSIYEELRMLAKKWGLDKDSVVFTGRVDDKELIGLYNTCHLFVFPSLWEGLGLPVLEAMACGAAVIGSNTTSLPEVIGWDEACFDPTDVDAISAKMERALTDDAFMDALKAHGAKHSAEFTWQESARRVLKALRETHAQLKGRPLKRAAKANPSATPRAALADYIADGRFSDARVWEFAACLAANEIEAGIIGNDQKIRLGWVTSWNTRCGIASYSANLLASVPLPTVILAPEAHNLVAPDGPDVVRCWHQGKEADLLSLAEQVGRAELTDVVVQFNYGFYNFDALSTFVVDQVRLGRRIYLVLHSTNDAFDIPGHRLIDIKPALSAASRVFVHSRGDIERLNRIGINDSVILLPQGIRLIPGASKPKTGGRTVIGSYGFFLPNKGLPELVEAVGLVCKSGRDVGLKMVNANYGDAAGVSTLEIEEAKSRATAMGIADEVEFHTEYLEDEASAALLRETDLIVYPYQRTGESSSAAVRMGLASGVPVAVTPLNIFDDVKESTFRLPGVTPTEMAAGITEALDALEARTPAAVEKISAAKAWCASHDVNRIADEFMRLIRRQAFTEMWHSFYETDLDSLLTRDCSFVGEALRPAVGAEIFVYGPYITVPAGLYRLFVYGSDLKELREGPAGAAFLTADFGTHTIDELHLHDNGGGVLLDAFVYLERDMENFEIVLSSVGDGAIAFTGYSLTRRYGSI